MKIVQRGPADTDVSKLVQNDKNVSPARREGERKVSPSAESAKVSISNEARQLQRIAELARKGDELRAAKLKSIKERMDKGEYQVDTEEVAKDIVRAEMARLLERK